ncbi:hypothetical protein J4212_01145 [Candidatus Woesearchaeota archaeon]|nr:hypothetical protein [Candidatus Woesearchaeota archaeon]
MVFRSIQRNVLWGSAIIAAAGGLWLNNQQTKFDPSKHLRNYNFAELRMGPSSGFWKTGEGGQITPVADDLTFKLSMRYTDYRIEITAYRQVANYGPIDPLVNAPLIVKALYGSVPLAKGEPERTHIASLECKGECSRVYGTALSDIEKKILGVSIVNYQKAIKQEIPADISIAYYSEGWEKGKSRVEIDVELQDGTEFRVRQNSYGTGNFNNGQPWFDTFEMTNRFSGIVPKVDIKIEGYSSPAYGARFPDFAVAAIRQFGLDPGQRLTIRSGMLSIVSLKN